MLMLGLKSQVISSFDYIMTEAFLESLSETKVARKKEKESNKFSTPRSFLPNTMMIKRQMLGKD